MCDTINVGTGKSVSIKHLLESLSIIINKKPKVILRPLSKGDPERSIGEYRKLDKILNINRSTFYDLKKGLKETIDFFSMPDQDTN